jgi:hypothetical protein
MSQTSTSPKAAKTAAAPKTDKPKRAGYLPSLPKGWTYQTIIATGPGGAQVTVDATSVANDQYDVTVVANDIDMRTSTVSSLRDGTAAIQAGAKALAKIAEAEAAARKARAEGLNMLGSAGGGVPEKQASASAGQPDGDTRL